MTKTIDPSVFTPVRYRFRSGQFYFEISALDLQESVEQDATIRVHTDEDDHPASGSFVYNSGRWQPNEHQDMNAWGPFECVDGQVDAALAFLIEHLKPE